MRVSGIQNYYSVKKNNSNNFSDKSFKAASSENTEIKGINGERLKIRDEKGLISVENISDPKVGSKFLISFNDPKYKGFKILFTPNTVFKSEENGLELNIIKDNQSFKGKVYGSIRKNDDGTCDERMKDAYKNFWRQGMYNEIKTNYIDKDSTSAIKNDYNFYIPSDGDGTRYRDITKLQGGVTKPASLIPATLNGQNMALVQVVLSNFTQTNKLDEGVGFIEVKPAQGSAYAFLEGLKNGTISTDKPLVFSWGDNFSDINVTKLILEHEKKNSGFTILSLLTDKAQIQSLGALKVNSIEDMAVSDFKEKPSRIEADEYSIPQMEDFCLGSVGPFVISKEVLKWIKDKYIENPASFRNPKDNAYDFSSMIITPLVQVLNNGEIKDEHGNELKLRAKLLPGNNTWSDLGSEKDFSLNMKMVRKGHFSNFPKEMRYSISKNVDDKSNITFDEKSKKMLEEVKNEYGLEIENSISYFNF